MADGAGLGADVTGRTVGEIEGTGVVPPGVGAAVTVGAMDASPPTEGAELGAVVLGVTEGAGVTAPLGASVGAKETVVDGAADGIIDAVGAGVKPKGSSVTVPLASIFSNFPFSRRSWTTTKNRISKSSVEGGPSSE
jgi:hypothetical protein